MKTYVLSWVVNVHIIIYIYNSLFISSSNLAIYIIGSKKNLKSGTCEIWYLWHQNLAQAYCCLEPPFLQSYEDRKEKMRDLRKTERTIRWGGKVSRAYKSDTMKTYVFTWVVNLQNIIYIYNSLFISSSNLVIYTIGSKNIGCCLAYSFSCLIKKKTPRIYTVF